MIFRRWGLLRGLFWTVFFIVCWLPSVVLRGTLRVLWSVILEMRIIVAHLPLIAELGRFARVCRVALQQRVPIAALRWYARPRYGDCLAFVLVGGIFALYGVSGLQEKFNEAVWYSNTLPDAPSAALGASISRFSRSTAATASRRFQLSYRPTDSLQQLWQQQGLAVEDALALSRAFADFFETRYPEQLKPLAMQIDVDPATSGEAGWRLRQIVLELSENYKLRLEPRPRMFGGLFLEAALQQTLPQSARYVVQGSVQSLLLSGRRYARNLDENRLGDTTIPLYLENLLLFLDRRLEARGGMTSGDTISALYSQQQKGRDPQLLYVRVLQPDSHLEMVYFHPTLDKRGYLYDSNGNAFVLSDWGEPLKVLRITSNFGMRVHPIKGYSSFHRGIDFGAPTGTPIYATQEGIVLKMSRDLKGYGHWLQIKHADGFSTLYGHLDDFHPALRLGYPVRKSEVIGFVGNTGLSNSPHLHYELSHYGVEIDPRLITQPEIRLLNPQQRRLVKQVMRQRRAQMFALARDD